VKYPLKAQPSEALTRSSEHFGLETISPLSNSERVLACCTIARGHLEAGDYDVGCAAVSSWWKFGQWPNQQGLTNEASAELLLTVGILNAWIASTRQVQGEQKQAADC
jgi:hypothetical protein